MSLRTVSVASLLDEDVASEARLGDVLLTFGRHPSPLPGRGASTYSVRAEGAGWMWRIQKPGAGWSGYPAQAFETKMMRGVLLGETYSATPDLGRLSGTQSMRKEAVSTLNGHFLLVAWHVPSQTWHVWTDRFGTVHAYYAHDGTRGALGTFFPAVAAVASRRQLDWLGLGGFFAHGFFPADRTFFDDVRILRPATHYVFDAEGTLNRAERYWTWHHEPDTQRSYDDTVDAFAEVFSTVVREQAGSGRVALPISGGLDSRATVAALTENGRPTEHLWPFSYGYTADSDETDIAARIANVRGLSLARYTIRPYLFDQMAEGLDAVEGFQDVTQCRQAFVTDDLARHADAVLAAHWGDVWLDDIGWPADQADMPDAVLAHTLGRLQKPGRAWLLKHLVVPHLNDDLEDMLRTLVRDGLAPYDHLDDPDFRIKAFKTDHWSFRWTLASVRMYQQAVMPRLVFYDTRLTDFFCTVPTDYVRGRRLQIDYLKRYAPDLARITWQARDANLYWAPHFDTWLLPRRALKKAWRMFRRPTIIQRNWEVQLLGNAQQESLKRLLLTPGVALHQWVDASAVRRLIRRFYCHPDGATGYTVSMLLTFAAWLERHGR